MEGNTFSPIGVSMSISGLNYILEKEEIVATQRTQDLFSRPEYVYQTYKQHIRTYIPLGRHINEEQSINGFEKKVVDGIRGGGALRGYITAEYGYGKTSTGLYLWDRASSNNILSVPPFQLNKLIDLIIASFGWVRYEIARKKPNLIDEAEKIYESIIKRNADSLAKKYDIEISTAKRMIKDKPELLDLTPSEFIEYFEKMTDIAKKAGYDGLLIIADEVQQYIEPEIKAGTKDPISPLFDVIGAILTRKKHLNFGLIFIIPPKELALLKQQRGDLIHRLLEVSLDLSSVYDRDFPRYLWELLAKEFDYREHEFNIVSQETLEALGQITSRSDLADGPRTVINTFRRMTQRYIDLGQPKNDPYSPYNLVNDFLSGKIQYDSPKKIPRIVKQALSHKMVKGNKDRERAIIWAAAFPNEGLPRSMQEYLGLSSVFDELAQSTLGDLLISVGDIHNSGFTLRGLDQVLVETDWLTTTIREFWRTYIQNADITQEKAIKAFIALITKRIFPDNQWSIISQFSRGLTRNAGLILEGAFNSFARQFPERTVDIRVLWEDEQLQDNPSQGELKIVFRLFCHFDWPEEKTRHYSEKFKIEYAEKQIEIRLNLRYQGNLENLSPSLKNLMGPIVSPYQLSPLLLLNMYQFLDEKREANLIPKTDDQQIEYGFQPDLLDNIFRSLFNKYVGATVNASEERIVELALLDILTVMYPDYDTLLHISNWSSSLQKYKNALKHLESKHERQGQVIFEGLKEEIADMFTLSNTGLDSFISNYSSIIEIAQSFPTKQEAEQGIKGAVRFQLHSLEKKIIGWLKNASNLDRVKAAEQLYNVHYIPNNEVYYLAKEFGYLHKETEAILDLMEERGVIEIDLKRGIIKEAISKAPSVDELENEVNEWIKDIDLLSEVFSDLILNDQKTQSKKAKRIIEEELRIDPNDDRLIRLKRNVKTYRRQLVEFSRDKHRKLKGDVSRLLIHLPIADTRQEERLKTIVQGSVDYVQQVNDLRIRLLRDYTNFDSQTESLKNTANSLEVILNNDELSFKNIVELNTKVKLIEKELIDLEEISTKFSSLYNDYAAWVGLVKSGSELLNEIQTLGTLVNDQQKEFINLSKEINGYLSANKLKALPDYPTYSIRINEISEAVRRIKNESVSHFNNLQEKYQLALMKTLGFPRDHLWVPHVYNPIAPEDSHKRLINEVQTSLVSVSDRLSRVLKGEQEAINSTLHSPQLNTIPADERELIVSEGIELRSKLENLSSDLNILFDSINEEKISDFPEENSGQFREILGRFKFITENLSNLHPKVEKINKVLIELKLTPLEEKLLRVIPSDPPILEASDLRSYAKELTNEDLWLALSGLHAKRRLRISVELVQYD